MNISPVTRTSQPICRTTRSGGRCSSTLAATLLRQTIFAGKLTLSCQFPSYRRPGLHLRSAVARSPANCLRNSAFSAARPSPTAPTTGHRSTTFVASINGDQPNFLRSTGRCLTRLPTKSPVFQTVYSTSNGSTIFCPFNNASSDLAFPLRPVAPRTAAASRKPTPTFYIAPILTDNVSIPTCTWPSALLPASTTPIPGCDRSSSPSSLLLRLRSLSPWHRLPCLTRT